MVAIPIFSSSSLTLSSVLQWRNSGIERNNEGRIEGGAQWYKRIATELALPVVAVASFVEAVVCGLFAVGEKIVLPKEKVHRFYKIAESSSFTCCWAIADLFYNLFHGGELSTHETSARCVAQNRTRSISFLREEDVSFMEYVEDGYVPGVRDPLISRIVTRVRQEQVFAVSGGAFLVSEIYNSADTHFQERFLRRKSALSHFILAKSIWIYACGSRKDSTIPQAMFSPVVIAYIESIRKNPPQIDLTEIFSAPERLNEVAKNEIPALKAIVEAAYKGERGSFLLTRCWKEALIALEKQQSEA